MDKAAGKKGFSSMEAFMTPAFMQQSIKAAANLNGWNCTISK